MKELPKQYEANTRWHKIQICTSLMLFTNFVRCQDFDIWAVNRSRIHYKKNINWNILSEAESTSLNLKMSATDKLFCGNNCPFYIIHYS